MKRFLSPAAVMLYAGFGIGLLIQMSMSPALPEGWAILAGDGHLRWDADRQKMTLYQHSQSLLLQMGTHDLDCLKVESTHPDSQVMLKVDNGSPTILNGKLDTEGGLFLINPNGIIVGPGNTIDVGGMNILSTLDLAADNVLKDGDSPSWCFSAGQAEASGTLTTADGDVILPSNFVENEKAPVTLDAHGNVYRIPSKTDTGTHFRLDDVTKDD